MGVYLDNNATTRPEPAVVEAMVGMLRDSWGNPSSGHRVGQAARQRLELARQSVARLINAVPAEIVLTSGSTESINLGIRGVLAALWREHPTRRTIITSPIEHEAVRDLCKSLVEEADATLRVLPLREGGVVDADALPSMLDDSVGIVTIQWANNETGVIHPLERIGALCRERGVPLHTDATQLIGKRSVDVRAMPVDLLSLSAHKFYGPKGAGALYARRGVRFRPIMHGAQERERRGGTENTAGIVGMGVAADLALAWLASPGAVERGARLRDRFEQHVLKAIPSARVNGAADRLWNTSNIGFPTLEAEALLLLLSERGVCASAGAACSSGSLDPSPVLMAMGVPPEYAHGSVRFSLGRETTESDVDEAAEILIECVARLQQSGVARSS
ncbi:MAG: aminotransferase class V-fold PLP-dependent enzyme [Phycisphaerae bacterium]|nr:aminotransferase class V-fold PLP-dependent enzyme [Phycisphaerae bacterium]